MLSCPNAPRKRDLLGTLLLSTLAGHYRYAHVTSLRCDAVNPPLLGMNKLVSEDSLRRNLARINETAGLNWLRSHLDYCTAPLLSEPWVLDIDTTAKPLYGHQEGAAVGYNPHKPGRPSHSYHTYIVSSLRLVLRVDVLPGDEHNVAHATDGLWSLLDHLGRARWPCLLRGDKSWGIEPVMAGAEQRGLPYLFRLRLTKNVRGALERAMRDADWTDAGQGWQSKETTLRLIGWSRQRRIILLRRKLRGDLAVAEDAQPVQKRLSFAEIDRNGEVWEYAALVTSLANEILTLGQLYRDRADCENAFDELKNQWGWGGFCNGAAGVKSLVNASRRRARASVRGRRGAATSCDQINRVSRSRVRVIRTAVRPTPAFAASPDPRPCDRTSLSKSRLPSVIPPFFLAYLGGELS